MDEILALLERANDRQYGGERVSQLAHALQCAALAERHGATAALIVACLLHDIGHLVDGGNAGMARRGIDARHEERGALFLQRCWGEAVTEPVRLHVDAKRYLCAVEAGYAETLSPASIRSLELQDGAFSAPAAAAFLQQPYAPQAVALRRWDEQAKDPAAQPPPLSHFVPLMQELLKQS